MSWSRLARDDAQLRVFDGGSGFPVVFQHGLGGDEAQVRGNFPGEPAVRRLTVECRAQGESSAGTHAAVLDRDVRRRYPRGGRRA